MGGTATGETFSLKASDHGGGDDDAPADQDPRCTSTASIRLDRPLFDSRVGFVIIPTEATIEREMARFYAVTK